MCCDENSQHPTPSHPGCESRLCPAYPLCLRHLHLLVTGWKEGRSSSPRPLTVFGLTGHPPNKDIENDSKKEMEVSKCHSNTQPSSSQTPREAVSAASLKALHNRSDCDVQRVLERLQAKPATVATKPAPECTTCQSNHRR